LLILALVLAALTVRLWGRNWGLPAILHHDEMNIGRAALSSLNSGRLCPKFYYHPALAVAMHQVSALVSFLVGCQKGLYTALPDIRLADFIPLVRAISATLGALLVLVVAQTARAITPESALPAAAVAAFGYLQVLHSHYATPDVALALCVQLVIYLCVKALATKRFAHGIAAAGVASLAASLKYTAALVAIPVLLAVGISQPKATRTRRLAIAAATMLALFAIINVCALLDLGLFCKHLAFEVFHYCQAGNLGVKSVVFTNPKGLSFHLAAIAGDVGYLAAGLAVVGLFAALRLRSGRDYVILLLAFAVPHIALFASARAAFPRNILVLTPAVAVLAGVAIAEAARLVRDKSIRPKVVFLATAIAIALPARATLLNDYLLTRPTTVQAVQNWLLENAQAYAGPNFKVASLHPLWTPRTTHGREVSIGELFIQSKTTATPPPQPSWFLQQGISIFVVENWGVRRFGRFEWPSKILGLIRRHCRPIFSVEGFPPSPYWFPSTPFAVPNLTPSTLFGPTTRIYLFDNNSLP